MHEYLIFGWLPPPRPTALFFSPGSHHDKVVGLGAAASQGSGIVVSLLVPVSSGHLCARPIRLLSTCFVFVLSGCSVCRARVFFVFDYLPHDVWPVSATVCARNTLISRGQIQPNEPHETPSGPGICALGAGFEVAWRPSLFFQQRPFGARTRAQTVAETVDAPPPIPHTQTSCFLVVKYAGKGRSLTKVKSPRNHSRAKSSTVRAGS